MLSCIHRAAGIAVAGRPAGGCHGTGDAADAASSLQDAVDVSAAFPALSGRSSRRPGGCRVFGRRRRQPIAQTHRRSVRLPGLK